ncbi:MAG TPA: hypothetical protein VLR88_11375 [Propionibacteriaceae bacterium]|nr:hypothetical protein [Propionibacteriaceae bacterium]
MTVVDGAGMASAPAVGHELDDPVLVVFGTVDNIEDVEAAPDRLVEHDTLWTGAGVPGAPEASSSPRAKAEYAGPHPALRRNRDQRHAHDQPRPPSR